MPNTYVIAEHCNIADFRIKRVVVSDTEPLDEMRKAVTETVLSYGEDKIPATTINIFWVTNNKRAERIVNAAEADQLSLFLEAKDSGNTVCFEVISTQRAAWLHSQQLDVLDYSSRNGGGYCKKRTKLIENKDFQKFIAERCLSKHND